MKKFTKSAEGLDFSSVAQAMDQSNICSYIWDAYQAFLEQNGLKDEPVVPMATHSIGGREWALAEEGVVTPLFFEESTFNGGWYVFREKDVCRLYCESATSGSSLTATKCQDGTWYLELQVPVKEDGQPYKGAYWNAFHRVADPAEVIEF